MSRRAGIGPAALARALRAAAAFGAAAALCGAVRVRTGGGARTAPQKVLYSTGAKAGAYSGTLSAGPVSREEAAAIDAAGAAAAGATGAVHAAGSSRLYVRGDGSGGALKSTLILPGAGADGRQLVFDYGFRRGMAAPALPAGMPDFGLGAPTWSAEIASTRCGYATFRQRPGGDAMQAIAAAYAAAGWKALPGGTADFAMFSKGRGVAVACTVPHSPAGGGVSVMQRNGEEAE